MDTVFLCPPLNNFAMGNPVDVDPGKRHVLPGRGHTQEYPAMGAMKGPPGHDLVFLNEDVVLRKVHIGEGSTHCGNRLSHPPGPLGITPPFPIMARMADTVGSIKLLDHIEVPLVPYLFPNTTDDRFQFL